jgi:hypothetical protein
VAEEGFDASVFDRALTDADLAPGGAAFRLAWGRDFRPENGLAFANLVDASVLIHGHEPCPEGFRIPNDHQIILDCCGMRGTYVLLPLDGNASHAKVASLVKYLH